MSIPAWVAALSATLLMQSVASFLTQSLPVVAPLITASAGLSPESIGNLAALVAAGTVLFLLLGGPFLARWGPVRTLQAGAALSAFAMLVAATGFAPALVLASLLLGIGYGPSPPAGSRILAATAPPGHRTLIFSIKQAGAPLGGAFAGLVTAPLAEHFGWPVAILATVAVALLAALAIEPLEKTLDVERDPARALSLLALFRRATWTAPVAALRLHGALPPLTVLAMSFATLQGCLFTFTVTWLTVVHGLGLVQAGTAFACMQGAGVVARIALGWLADRTGQPSHNLLVQSLVASAAGLGFALMPAAAPLAVVYAMSAAIGFLAASWNGIYMSEVARLVRPQEVAAATSGSTLFTFLGYLAAPALFALLVSLTGSWTLAFLVAAGQLGLVGLWAMVALRRALLQG
jgi:MFS family permease